MTERRFLWYINTLNLCVHIVEQRCHVRPQRGNHHRERAQEKVRREMVRANRIRGLLIGGIRTDASNKKGVDNS